MTTVDESNKVDIISISEGNITITDSLKHKNPAQIIPGENVKVYVNAKLINTACNIFEEDEVRVELNQIEASWEPNLFISKDKMEARLKIIKQNGYIFELEDQSPSPVITINARVKENIPPKISKENLIDFLKEKGIVYGINEINIGLLINLEEEVDLVVAEGKKVILGKNGCVKPICKEFNMKDFDCNSFIHIHEINSIDKGETIAELIPPINGEEGINIFGEKISTPAVKAAKLILGNGCRLDDDGKNIISTIAGRPSVKGNSVSVQPGYTINGDVDAKNGHVYFKGDVTILGNVLDEMKVEATGKIVVKGYIANAIVLAGTDLIVNKHILGSEIRAGGNSALCQRLAQKLQQLIKILPIIPIAMKQLKNQPTFRKNKDIQKFGDGILIKFILANKLHQLPTMLEDITKDLKEISIALPENSIVQYKKLYDGFVENINKNVPFLGLKEFDKINAYFNNLIESTKIFIKTLISMIDHNFKLSANYVQSSVLKSSGDIIILGNGVYNSKLYAGGNVSVKGVFRGGELISSGNISVHEVGSSVEIETILEIKKSKVIKADIVHPKVHLKAGSRVEIIRNLLSDLTFCEKDA